MKRTIETAQRREKSTLIRLSCGHERSLGGHVYLGQRRTPAELIGMSYDCHDSYCGGRS